MIIWKRMHGFDSHFISEHGDVFSLRTGKVLKQSETSRGYKCIVLWSGEKYSNRFVHRLVMQTFFGLDERQVNHKDGNKKNNNVSNLEYMTQSENQRHAISTGLRKLKYSKELILKIKNLKGVITKKDITERLCVPMHLVKDVHQGRILVEL